MKGRWGGETGSRESRRRVESCISTARYQREDETRGQKRGEGGEVKRY